MVQQHTDLLRGLIIKAVLHSAVRAAEAPQTGARFLDTLVPQQPNRKPPGDWIFLNAILEHRFHLLELLLSATLRNESGCAGKGKEAFLLYGKKANRRERSAGGQAVSGVINGKATGKVGHADKPAAHLRAAVAMWVKVTLKLKRAAAGHVPDASFADSLSESLVSAAQRTLSESQKAQTQQERLTAAPPH